MNKYGNKKLNGFDSKKEANRYAELTYLERAGEITNLRRQVRYELIPRCGRQRPIYYIADFVYDTDNGTIVEDVKGYRTDVYRMKKKLMYWRYRIMIYEV